MLLAIHQTSITSEQLGDDDRVNGCKLLLNLRSSINALHHPCLSDRLSLQLLQPLPSASLTSPRPARSALPTSRSSCTTRSCRSWGCVRGARWRPAAVRCRRG
jgi:hypothetical protein